jgi:transposase
MRFVPTKSEQQQSGLMLHHSRQLLVRQRTMLSNAIRGHMAELGIVSAKGRNGTAELLKIIANAEDDRVPAIARFSLDILARQHEAIAAEIGAIEKRIQAWHRSCEERRRLGDIPCVGPIVATALVAEVGGLERVLVRTQPGGLDWACSQAAFDRRQGASRWDLKAGKSVFGIAARRRRHGRYPVCAAARHEAALACAFHGAPPIKVAAVALAKKIARLAWAMMVRGERFKEPRLLPVA